MPFQPLRLAAAAAAAAAFAAPAWAGAGASASASLTQITLALVDLAPNDGIVPSMTFEHANSTAYTNFQPSDQQNWPNFPVLDSANAFLSPLTVLANGNEAVVTSDSLHASFAASSNSVVHYVVADSLLASSTGDGPGLRLSPNTQLVFSAQFSLDASTADSPCRLVSQMNWCQDGIARVEARAFGGTEWDQHFVHELHLEGVQGGGRSDHLEGVIQFSVSNRTDSVAEVDLILHTNALTGFSTDSPPPPVPEPSTLALMLGAMPVLWTAARRRRPG
jgi:hypothetical protein